MKDANAATIAKPSAVPTEPVLTYDTYSVLEIGKPGVPKLTRLQLAWLQLIHDDPKYAARWTHLRWTVHETSETPVIVFEADVDELAATEPLIIGEECNSAYDPDEETGVALPHFDQPCKPSEQLRVRGQKSLLGWEP